MQARAQVNADPEQVVMLHTNEMPWEPTEHRGISRKVLELVNDPKKGRETALLKFEPGAGMPTEVLTMRVDVFVLDGAYSDGHGEYGQHTFVRNPAGAQHTPSSRTGCVLYVKWRVPIRPKQPDEPDGDRREDHAVDALPPSRRRRAAPLPRHARHRDVAVRLRPPAEGRSRPTTMRSARRR